MPPGCQVEFFGKLEAVSLPGNASEVLELLGWETFEKLKAIILPEYASKMPGWETFGKLKGITLREQVSADAR